jgi:hypothetical protein
MKGAWHYAAQMSVPLHGLCRLPSSRPGLSVVQCSVNSFSINYEYFILRDLFRRELSFRTARALCSPAALAH